MRTAFIILGILLSALVGGCSALTPGSVAEEPPPTPSPCTIDETLAETFDEGTFSLVKVLSLTGTRPTPLADAETRAVFLAMLVSTRHYHEEIAQQVPDCARAYNQAFIRTIAATQDVLAYQMARQLDPENGRLESQLQQARSHLDSQWAILAETKEEASLVTPP